MAAVWGPRAEEIIEWAARYEAASVLPELVRRLLLATVHVEQLEMRSRSGVRLPGWDGVVVARATSPFCPAGVSGWELSTAANPKRKADQDIRKREAGSPPPIVPADASYVVVTAQRFRDKQRWVNEQKRRGAWGHDVKVIDADDLAMWLGQCPAVAHWFMAEQLGRPVSGWSDLRSWRRRWEQRTTPPLPAELVLEDRELQVVELERWLERLGDAPGALLRIRAEQRDEACLFLAAVVASDETDGSERWANVEARTLVVESRDAWRAATGLDTSVPLILIPMFSDFDPGERSTRHAVVIPVDPSHGSRSSGELRIDEPLPWRALVPRLSSLFPRDGEAERHARESGGRLSVLQRALGGMQKPSWVEQPREQLVAMLLMGAWEPRRPGDAAIAETLGVAPHALEGLCVELANSPEPAITREGEGWRWGSHADAWRVLWDERVLSELELDRFREIIEVVLGEDDPRYELPKDERQYAFAQGKALCHSEALRAGLAESLVRLSLADPQLEPVYHAPKGARLVGWMVAKLLGPRWTRWASLSELLPMLAEAAPRAFLDALDESLRRDDGVAQLLSEEPSHAMGHAPHTGLLWALEILGWKDDLMPRVAHALAGLAEQDPGGTLSSRPLASLQALFDIVVPQTTADDPTRREVLAGLVGAAPEERYPKVGWLLVLGLVQGLERRFLHRSEGPRFLPWTLPPAQEMPTLGTVHARVHHVLGLVLDVAGTACERWAALIDARLEFSLPDAESQRVFSTLIARKPTIEDPGARIWNALRQRLGYVHQLGSSSPEHVGPILERLTAAYEAFTPADPVVAALPLFRTPYYLPEPHDRRAKMRQRIPELQQDFLRQLASRDDRQQLLDDLVVSLAPDLHVLGYALGQSPLADEMEQRLLHDEPPEPWRGLIRGVAVSLRHARGFEWFAEIAKRLADRGRCDDVVSAALGLRTEPELWALVRALGQPVLGAYWRAVDFIDEQQDPVHYADALDCLLTVRNAKTALDLASWKAEHLPTQALLSTLELVASMEADSEIHRSSGFDHEVASVFTALEKRDDVEIARAAGLESVLALRSVGIHERIPYFLDRVLAEHPEEFARFVELRYRARPEDHADPANEPREEATEEERARSRWAYYVLDSWSYPGRDIDDPERRERVVFEWAERALTLTREAHRRDVGELEVAKVLARVPPASDGHWPCLAARRLLETGRHHHLGRGLTTAKYNQWGRHVRVIDDGNEQTTLTERYLQAAIALGKRWPRTAAMLDDLADMHRTGAERDAKRAYEERVAEGHARGSKPSPMAGFPSNTGASPMTSPKIFSLSGLECTAVGPAPTLSMGFGPRLNLITGDNGLGKTFLLHTVWWTLTGAWVSKQPAVPFGAAPAGPMKAEIRPLVDGEPLAPATFNPRRDRWERPHDWPTTDALVIYARVDGGFSVWDPEVMGEGDPQSAALDISRQELWDRVERDDVVLCNGLLIDWFQWQSRHPETFERFFGLVRALFAADAVVEVGGAVPLSLIDDREVPTILLPSGEVRIDLLSAGMKRVLGLAYVVQWAFGRHQRARRQRTLDASPFNIVFLFDEVEAHLHPRWQRALLPDLLAQLEQLGGGAEVQVFATTHAPFVAASCETIFDESRDELLVFDEHDGQVVLENVPWIKHGDITNWVTSKVFGLTRARSLEAERAIDAAYAFMRGEPTGDPQLTTREQIHARLCEVLADSDRFWPVWIVFARDGAAQ